MVGRNYIIENRQAVTLLRLEQPIQVEAPIAHPDLYGDSHDVIFINDLNEAQRLRENKFAHGEPVEPLERLELAAL